MELARAKESESNPRTKENTNHEKNSKKNYYPIKVFYGEIKVKKNPDGMTVNILISMRLRFRMKQFLISQVDKI